jgi:PAS domain S-box-containing protein
MDSSFSALSKAVLKGMYNSHFKDFVRRKLVEQSQVKLGMTGGAEREGIGEIWCVSNPRLRDHPLVLVSEAFCKMTGYRAEAILGRNCRFLQGPGTSPGSVQRIRQAIAAGEEHTELLLNYRSSGEPFWNLLAMIPLRARDGSVAYFVGGQVGRRRPLLRPLSLVESR